MLKETPRSLRAYFVLVALFCLLAFVGTVTQDNRNPVVLMLAVITLGFGMLDGYIACRMTFSISQKDTNR